jgi:hypothetical protein
LAYLCPKKVENPNKYAILGEIDEEDEGNNRGRRRRKRSSSGIGIGKKTPFPEKEEVDDLIENVTLETGTFQLLFY